MKLTVTTPAPHSKEQHALMMAFDTPNLIELWMPMGTKFGKTMGAASGMSVNCWLKLGMLYRWVAPIYSQSKIGMAYCKKTLPAAPYAKSNNGSPPRIYIPRNDSQIEFWHGGDPESLEGEGVMGYVIDECSKQKEQVYSSAKTTVSRTKGPIVGISTPRGKNWFWRKCMEAKDKMEWAIANGKPITHMYLTAPTLANPTMDKQVVIEARVSLPDRLWRQYYLAEFVDDGDVFAGYRACLYLEKEIVDTSSTQFWIWDGYKETDEGKADVEVVIGSDWAKKKDFTVFTAWDFKTRKMCGYMRFQGESYITAIKRLVWFSNKFRKTEMIYHDKTGIGEVIDDMLDKTSLPFEGIVFTNKSKSFMVNALIFAVQQKECSLPWWSELCKEMDSFEVTTNDIGIMSFSAPEGAHDDIVCSMILGWSAVVEYADQDLGVKVVEELQERKSSFDDWLQEAEDDLAQGLREVSNITRGF